MHGHTRWVHRDHVFARPHYDWDWGSVRSVTCVAADALGGQYPVTEETEPGFSLAGMSDVQDDALDRCSSESGPDADCVLVNCSQN